MDRQKYRDKSRDYYEHQERGGQGGRGGYGGRGEGRGRGGYEGGGGRESGFSGGPKVSMT